MSTSPRPALGSSSRAAIEPFLYAEAVKVAAAVAVSIVAAVAPETGELLEAAAREAGRMEAEAQARTEYDAQLIAVRQSIAAALRDFALERKAYYQQVEGDVV